jgi:hypothetical protein
MEEVDVEEKGVAGPLKSPQADWLDVHGGFVLLGGGILMIALACLFSAEVAIAPIFATFGCGLFVFAAFYSRIEGRVEANKQGFAAAVGAAQRLSRSHGLPPDLQDEAVKRAVENLDVSTRKPDEARRAGEEAAKQVVEEIASEWKPDEAVESFVEWLVEKNGFPLDGMKQEVRSSEGTVDLLAEGSDEVLIAEVSTRAGLLGPGNVFRLLSLEVPDLPADANVRRAFVVPLAQKDELSIATIAGLSEIEMYGVSADGQVERL